MAPKKNVGALANASLSNCLFLRLPPQLFGERILQLLTWDELLELNVSLTNHALRKEWWLVNEKKPLTRTSRVLAYAIEDGQRIPIRGKWEARLVKKLGVRTNNWQLNFGGDLDTPAVRALLAYCGDSMTSLEIANLMEIHRLRCITPMLAPYLAQLSSLRLRGMYLYQLADLHRNHEPILMTIANNCKQLARFSIEKSRGTFFAHRDKTFEAAVADVLKANAETLADLSLEMVGLTAKALGPLDPTVLRHLRLESCDFYDGHGVELEEGVVPLMQRLVPNLVTLDISGLWNCTNAHCLRMLAILQSCSPTLITVDLSGWWSAQVDDTCVDALCTQASLRHLNISATISDFEHEFAPREQPYGEVTTGAVVRLAQACPVLRTSALRRHRHVGPEALHALLNHCPHMQRLSLFHTAIPDGLLREKLDECRASGRKVVFTQWNQVWKLGRD